MAAVKIKKLKLARSARFTLSIESLELHEGEVLGILGPNGAGKSTFFNLLSGDDLPYMGSIAVHNRDLKEISQGEQALMRSVVRSQDASWQPLTVRESLMLGAIAHGGFGRVRSSDKSDKEMEIASWARKLELYPLMDNPLQLLSSGERQRAAIARACLQLGRASSGKILLLDEPFSHLDPGHIKKVGELLRELAGRSVAVAVIMHDVGLASMLCDRVALFKNGSLRDVIAGSALKAEHWSRIYDTSFTEWTSSFGNFYTPDFSNCRSLQKDGQALPTPGTLKIKASEAGKYHVD